MGDARETPLPSAMEVAFLGHRFHLLYICCT